MRELTFDECHLVYGGFRWGWAKAIGRWLSNVGAAIAAQVGIDHMDWDTHPDEDTGGGGFDPSGVNIVESGTAWGADQNGQFQSGWYWQDDNGIYYYDMDRQGGPESRGYFSEDGTYWTDNMDGQWVSHGGPPWGGQ